MVAHRGVGDKCVTYLPFVAGAQVALDGRCGRGGVFAATQFGTHQDQPVSMSVHRRETQAKCINDASRTPRWRHYGHVSLGGWPKRSHLREGITGKQSGDREEVTR